MVRKATKVVSIASEDGTFKTIVFFYWNTDYPHDRCVTTHLCCLLTTHYLVKYVVNVFLEGKICCVLVYANLRPSAKFSQ